MGPFKILVIGGPEGLQSRFVSVISEVKVKSSARTPTGEGTVPMDFGRLKVDGDLDLQVFGVERDRVDVIAEAVSPGIVGSIVLIGLSDVNDFHFSRTALDELAGRDIPTVIAAVEGADPEAVRSALEVNAAQVVAAEDLTRDAARDTILQLLEMALAAVEGAA